MTTIAQARVQTGVVRPLAAPIDQLRAAGIRTSLFQGCAYAVDPRNAAGYVFQLQAVRTGPGDVEDLRVHRFRYRVAVRGFEAALEAALDYVDTMTIERGGHVQSCHVRISAAGNPYVWAGLEDYDADGQQTGKSLYRIRYTPDKTIAVHEVGAEVLTTSRKSSNVQRVYTGPGSVDAVGCPDWTIVLRRPGAKADTYEWHQERDLLRRQADYRGSRRPAPPFARTVGKLQADDDYQSSLAQGKYNSDVRRAYRITGADRILIHDTRSRGSDVDLTDQAKQVLGVDHVEPEGAFTLGGLLHVAVQTDSVAKRRITYLPLKW